MPKDHAWQDELESLAQAARDESTPLYSAAGPGDTSEVSRLLASGVHPDPVTRNGWTPLHYAAKEGNLRIVELLVESGANVNARTTGSHLSTGAGDTPLHWAAYGTSCELVRFLLSKGAAPDARNENKETPLHLAVMKSTPRKPIEQQMQIVQVLLRHGANVNAKSRNGLTPLSRAEYGSELASMLRSNGGKHTWELGIRGLLSRLFGRS